jgi:hypothetical protein
MEPFFANIAANDDLVSPSWTIKSSSILPNRADDSVVQIPRQNSA